jgi:protein-S-isoprenylcysteine O-methyltransferase Ste14
MFAAIPDLPLFAIVSALLLWSSRRPLRHPGSHGFWRFFGWECILAVAILNRQEAGPQWLSETLLQISVVLLLAGLWGIFRRGRIARRPEAASFYVWERTTALVESGVYRWIRHPMYTSLLMLAWGMYFRHADLRSLLPAVLASYFLWRTALADESECVAYFGDAYRDYMQRTRRFLPWLV